MLFFNNVISQHCVLIIAGTLFLDLFAYVERKVEGTIVPCLVSTLDEISVVAEKFEFEIYHVCNVIFCTNHLRDHKRERTALAKRKP